MEWRLYRRMIALGVKEYAWVDPGGIIRFNRALAPLGFRVSVPNRVGQPAHSTLKGWNKVKPKGDWQTVQDNLSRGYIV